jgi:hypothetical protein
MPTEKQFPIHLWDRLIPQAVIRLNLLRQSRLNPKLSAHAQLNGPFHYNATPISPPGTRVIIHEKTDHRGSWSPRGLNAWYVGPEMEHYRAHRVYCSTTGHKRISDTVEFFHNTVKFREYQAPTRPPLRQPISPTHCKIPRQPHHSNNRARSACRQ